MCGITGIVNFKRDLDITESIIKPMADALRHRGPEAEAFYYAPNHHVVFGHRRLCIVGLDNKPTIMSVRKKGTTHNLAIVFNGEIYNFEALKKELRKKGYTFISPSDFEVIVHGWTEWGKNCVKHFDGEFAFVVYDEETNEVFMARDRTGVKPLYYTFSEAGDFIFGSEPKAILAHPDVVKKVDVKSVAEFVLNTHTLAAGVADLSSSFFEGIKQIKAGFCATLNAKGFKQQQYWDIPFTDKAASASPNFVKRIRRLLTASIELRVPREVPVSIGLSGGLDSSIVAVIAQRSRYAKKLIASCVRYVNGHNEDYKYAEILARRDNFPLIGPNLDPKIMMQYIDKCVTAMDAPFDTIRRMGMFANYETIKQAGYKVALIGEGADEFNLGYYHTFPGLKLDYEACNTPEKFKKLYGKRAEYVLRYFSKKLRDQIRYKDIIENFVNTYYEQCPSKNSLKRMQYFYAKVFLQFLEDSNDRMAMAHAVEARLPFLDSKVIEACIQVPTEQNIQEGLEKVVLRKAFRPVLPQEIRLRKKAPFPANENLKVCILIQRLFEKNIQKANPEVWKLLDKHTIQSLNTKYSESVKTLKILRKNGRSLNEWLPISQKVELRTSHVFALLTLLRWYKLYFSD